MLYKYTSIATHADAVNEKIALEKQGRTTGDIIAVKRRFRGQSKDQHQKMSLWQVPYVVTVEELLATAQ